MYCYIGIDIGSTNIKAIVFSKNDKQLFYTSKPTPTKTIKAETVLYEYDVQEIYDTVCECLQEISTAVKEYPVRALSVSSIGESGIPLDINFTPLTNAIAWFDQRSIPQTEKLVSFIGKEEIYQITGQIPSYKFGITKLMWFKENHPELFAKTKYWMAINDYILYRLCGERVCDYSIASRSMAFDIHNLDWSSKILNTIGISKNILGTPVPGGTYVGTLTRDAVLETGLPTTTQIITGGHDHACAVVGADTLYPDTMLSSMGTSEVSLFVVDTPMTSHEMFKNQCSISAHCSPMLYRALTSMQACGASIEWFLSSIGAPLDQKAKCANINRYEYLHQVAAQRKTDPSLLYFPLLRGSLLCQNAGGVFLGMRDCHSIEDFAKSLLDGICSEFTYQTQKCLKILNLPIHTAKVVGGPTQSDYLMQRKADISGLSIEIPPHQEAACYGAALLAAIGAGDVSFDTLSNKQNRMAKNYTANSDENSHIMYNRYYCARKKVDDIYLSCY